MNVLAVGCHPDDIEIGCGGTLIKYAKRGDNVTVCHMTNGNMGHVRIMPDELAVIRTAEAQQGCTMLGASQVISMDVADLKVDSYDQGIVYALTEVIRTAKPDVIITHSPNDYMKDHVETSKLVFDASFSATIPHFTSVPHINNFAPIFYMDTLAGVDFQPEQYVDITEEIELKLQALDCHESQVKWMRDHDGIDFLDMIRTCSKYRGYQCGAGYAEGFILCKAYPRMTHKPMLP